MAGPRKVHEISDSEEDDVEQVSNGPKKSRQEPPPAKETRALTKQSNHKNECELK